MAFAIETISASRLDVAAADSPRTAMTMCVGAAATPAASGIASPEDGMIAQSIHVMRSSGTSIFRMVTTANRCATAIETTP